MSKRQGDSIKEHLKALKKINRLFRRTGYSLDVFCGALGLYRDARVVLRDMEYDPFRSRFMNAYGSEEITDSFYIENKDDWEL